MLSLLSMRILVSTIAAAALGLSLAACGGGPSYSDDDLEHAFTQCNIKVAVSHGANAELVGCMRDEVGGLSFGDAKKYLQKREKNDTWLDESPQ